MINRSVDIPRRLAAFSASEPYPLVLGIDETIAGASGAAAVIAASMELRWMVLGVNGIRLVANRGGVARMIEAVPAPGRTRPSLTDARLTPKPLDPVVRLPAVARNVVLPSRLLSRLMGADRAATAHGSHNLLFCPSYVIPLPAVSNAARPPRIARGLRRREAGVRRWTVLKTRFSYPPARIARRWCRP